jgi:ubiquinone/menaquinone biosynthesis C-methylase UbiE
VKAYYEARAHEYDEWWVGRGGFAARQRPGWAEEVAELAEVVSSLPGGRVLDVACGTAFLTRHLRGDVTALDQSPSMVEVARSRLPEARVVRGEAVPLPFAGGAFDVLFTSHFYGHLLEAEREAFVREARRVSGRLVVADSARRPDVPAARWDERVLNDGSRHRVFKRWFRGPELAEELGGGEVLHDGYWFVVVASP